MAHRSSGQKTLAIVSATLVQLATLSAALADESPPAVSAEWRELAPQAVARVEAPAAAVGGLLYVFGGFTRPDGGKQIVTKRVDVYDPSANSWRRLSDMPVAVTHVVAAVDGETVWLAGGYDRDKKVVARSLEYHAPSDSWSEGPPLPEPRGSGSLVRHGRNLHYFGGFAHDRNTTYGDHWVLPLDRPETWIPRAPLPQPRGHFGAAVLNGRIYAIGGQFNHDDDRRDVGLVHAYDPATDTWSEVAPVPTGRSHTELSTIVWDGRIYIFGGRNDGPGRSKIRRNQALPDVTQYDPKTDRWTPQPELPIGLVAPIAVEIAGRIVVTNGSSYRTHEPRAETWGGSFVGEAGSE